MSDGRGRVRLGCEALEARDVPTGLTFFWYGTVSTDANDPQNYGCPAGTPAPGDGDYVIVGANSAPDCIGLSGKIRALDVYVGHVVIDGPLNAQRVRLAGGALDIPAGATISDELEWTGGTLNSTSVLSTVEMLPGSHADIGEPSASSPRRV